MAMKTRNLKMTDGSVTSFRFSDVEWSAIEQIAEARGMRWPEWARQLIDADRDALGGPAPSRSGLLRRAALEEAFGGSLLAERAEMMAEGAGTFQHPMLTNRFWPVDSGTLEDELASLNVYRRFDFGSFELIAGHRPPMNDKEPPEPVVLLRNKLEGNLSVVLTRDPIED